MKNFYVDAGVIAYDDLHCSGPNSPDGFGPVQWKHVATAWIETADVVSSGTGKVWFQVLTPGLPDA